MKLKRSSKLSANLLELLSAEPREKLVNSNVSLITTDVLWRPSSLKMMPVSKLKN